MDAKTAADRIYRLPMQPDEYQHFLGSLALKPLRPHKRPAAAAPAARSHAAARRGMAGQGLSLARA